ncbi:MAG: hypothetical protein ACLFVQ_03400 [Chitinispirillaceae bacterium]
MNFFRNEQGNTLPVVLLFASCGLIIVTMYLAHQVRSTDLANRAPSSLQALLNARSGIYKGMEKLQSEEREDTLSTISAVDQIFRMDLFDSLDLDPEPSMMGETETIQLFKEDTVNYSEVSITAQGMYCLVTSKSTVQKATRTVEVILGSSAPARPDTVIILENDLPLKGSYRGKLWQKTGKSDSKSQEKKTQFRSFLSSLRERIVSEEDSTTFDVPLTIQSHKGVTTIPDTVRSHLVLDGTFSEITWKEKKKITVQGDLQLVGSFTLEDLDMAVGGEIRILDEAKLTNVSLFSMGRIFIGDNARFQGNALTTASINVYGNASVEKKSSLCAFGTADSIGSRRKDIPRNYSILLSEQSVFDGTAIALGNPGGIKTDPGTQVSGILWAENLICHSGQLSGLIKASSLFDCSQMTEDTLVKASDLEENSFSGTAEPLSSIGEYRMPYFMGDPFIISWKED